jgi:hypothetical protein
MTDTILTGPPSGQTNPEDYFNEIRKSAEKTITPPEKLTAEDERRMSDGFAIEEMTKTSGWRVLVDILSNLPKSHVDPRGMTRDDWEFAELNAFHAGKVAEELLIGLNKLIEDAHELHKRKTGAPIIDKRVRL